jgi:hypothetical protein
MRGLGDASCELETLETLVIPRFTHFRLASELLHAVIWQQLHHDHNTVAV